MTLLVALASSLIGMGAVFAFVSRPAAQTAPPLAFSAQPGPDVPTLAVVIGDSQTNDQAVTAVVRYYQQNHDRLAALWRIDNEQRLQATFAMYIVHLSVPYGVVEKYPANLLEFAHQPRAHCGTYTIPQLEIAAALGLEWRLAAWRNGDHGWLEVRIGDHWELFDATTNVWVDQPAEELLKGESRHYRNFYTPILDEKADPIYRAHIAEGWNVLWLRSVMPQIGLTYSSGELMTLPPGKTSESDRG